MALEWNGAEVTARLRQAQKDAVNATMAASILHAKSDHMAGAHGRQRFETQTGELERSLKIVQPAREDGNAVAGRWGSTGLEYALRIELGFQGQDASGRAVNSRPYPYLRPAAEVEYPKLAGRIRRALG